MTIPEIIIAKVNIDGTITAGELYDYITVEAKMDTTLEYVQRCLTRLADAGRLTV